MNLCGWSSGFPITQNTGSGGNGVGGQKAEGEPPLESRNSVPGPGHTFHLGTEMN